MRADLRFTLLMLLAAGLALVPARASERQVEIDWEPIEGAHKYEVKWDGGVEEVKEPRWSKRLPAGRYRMRLRAIGEDGIAGQWTEDQQIEVKPRPPQAFTHSETDKIVNLTWESRPKISRFEVEVQDANGKVLLRQETKETSLSFARPKTSELKVSIRAAAEGTDWSSAKQWIFALEDSKKASAALPAAGAGVKRMLASLSANPTGRRYPGQPAPLPPDPELAVQRYRLTGERPLPPSSEEWAMATTPEAKEALRRRTIASARVELSERLELKRSPDLRFSLAPMVTVFRYGFSDRNDSGTGVSGTAVAWELEAEWNRSRPWGAYFHLHQLSFKQDGYSLPHLIAGAGVQRNLPLDASGQYLHLGAGVSFSQYAVRTRTSSESSQDSQSGDSVAQLRLSVLGVGLRASHRVPMFGDWSWETGAKFEYAPPQRIFGKMIDEDLYAMSGAVRGGPVWRVSGEVEVAAGLSVGGRKLAPKGEDAIWLAEKSAYVKGVYRLGPPDGRTLASESAGALDSSGLWTANLQIPVGIRSTMELTSMEEPYDSGRRRAGLSAELWRRWSATSPWSVGVRLDTTSVSDESGKTQEGQFGLLGGWDTEFLGRRDTTARMEFGVVRASAASISRRFGPSGSFQSWDLESSASLKREWTPRLATRAALTYAHALLVSMSDSGFSSGHEIIRAGLNHRWGFELVPEYRVSRAVAVSVGYQFRSVRYSLVQSDVMSESNTRALEFTENAVKAGLTFRW